MPKRTHKMAQASLDNLRPGGEAHQLTREDRVKAAKSTNSRRSAQKAIERLLEKPLTPKQIKQYELMGQQLDGDEHGIDILMAGLLRAGIDGSEKCARLILEYAGEKVSHGDSPDLMDLLEIIRDSAKKKDEDA